MAVRRSQNWLNQQRVDVPHLRSIESAVRNDFDELLASFAIGEDASYIIRGFTLNMVGAIGSSASSLQMIVENSALMHGKSSQAGTFFMVPSGEANQTVNSTTNPNVQGSFTPSALNYIGIEFNRAVDNSTSAQVFLWNPTNKNEISKTVPLAETLNYKIVVTSSIWAANVLPISIVETDSSNNVLSVEDRRPMLFRLGTGGPNTPNPFYKYPWNHDTEGREENFWKSSSAVSPFKGGDKQIQQFKEWADAVMSSILEIKGTTYWYSDNSGGSIIKLRGDLSQLQMTGSGKWSHALAAPGQINWSSDIFFDYIGSRLSYKIEAYAAGTNVTLADNEVAYLNLVRGVDIIPNLILTQGSPVVTSVGAVSWTNDILAGDFIKVGSQDDTKYYKVLSVDTASQVTLSENFLETSTGSGGVQAKYAYGFYQVVAVPTTNRHVQIADRKDVPFNEDTYWILLRNDNGGSIARAYIRGSSGGELQQGEDREISDGASLETLEYIGAPTEVSSKPDYTNALVTSLAEERVVTFPAASALTTGQYWTINSALDVRKFYVWANIDGAGGNPLPGGLEEIEVALLSSDTNLQVAAKYATALSAFSEFDITDNLDGTVDVNNSQLGVSSNAADVDMGVGFSINTTQEGIGAFNRVIVDEENLTKSIKRLDTAVGDVQDSLDIDPYSEIITIVSGAPADDNEMTGPVAASTNVLIPLNSRISDVQETYIVGRADLIITLGGITLVVDKDYTEVGSPGDASSEVQFTFQLEVDDVLEFRKFAANGSGSGGGSASGVNLGAAEDADVFKQTVGTQLQFRRLKAGTNVSISQDADSVTITANAGVSAANVLTTSSSVAITDANDIVNVLNAGFNLTITLPDATASEGKIFYLKKLDAGNTFFLKSVFGQTLDGVDIDAAPKAIITQYESITIAAVAGNWWIY